MALAARYAPHKVLREVCGPVTIPTGWLLKIGIQIKMSTQRTHNRSSPRGKWTNSQYSHLTKLYGKPYHTGGTKLFLQIVFPKLGQDNEPKLRGGKGGSQSEIKRHMHGRMKLWGQDVMRVGTWGEEIPMVINNTTKNQSLNLLPTPTHRP